MIIGVWSQPVSALSLKIAPHSYEASLGKGEVKKGFVDVSNPEYRSVKVRFAVQAFRQAADDGSLQFYDSEQLRAGVKLDYETMTLGPREAYRVYFILDGSKLPEGDVFGAIFATTVPEGAGSAEQAVRVGTLLLLQNGTPSAHEAHVVGFRAGWLQVGEGLWATIKLKNPAPENAATGFKPKITFASQPYGSKIVDGPLLFAGRTREVQYTQPGNYFGPMYLKASVGESSRGHVVFAITGYWRWLAPVLLVVALAVLGWSLKRRR